MANRVSDRPTFQRVRGGYVAVLSASHLARLTRTGPRAWTAAVLDRRTAGVVASTDDEHPSREAAFAAASRAFRELAPPAAEPGCEAREIREGARPCGAPCVPGRPFCAPHAADADARVAAAMAVIHR